MIFVVTCLQVATPFRMLIGLVGLPFEEKLERKMTKRQEGSCKVKTFIGAGLFLITGIEMTVNGWLPTYGVQLVGLSYSQVTVYGTLFWSMSTIFRFAAAAMNLPIALKLRGILSSMLVCSLLCIIMQTIGTYRSAAYFASLSFGMNCSAVFPLLVSISSEYSINIEPKQLSRIMIDPALSAGITTGLTGALMGKNTYLLFYILSLLSLSLFGISKLIVWCLEEGQKLDASSQMHEMEILKPLLGSSTMSA